MNWLALEPLLVARIRESMDGLVPARHVQTASELAGVTERAQVSPAVHVLYRGSTIVQETGNGLIAEILQSWITVVAVRNVAGILDGEAARADAGALLTVLFEALAGWKPGTGFRTLIPVDAPASGYTKGFGYHPLQWTTRIQMRGTG